MCYRLTKLISSFLFATFCLVAHLACFDKQPGDATLDVYAAASLGTALPEIARAFEAAHPGTKVIFNFAASSILAKQVEQGASADVYISADEKWMAYLDEKSQLQPGTKRVILSNRLVVITPLESELNLRELADLLNQEINYIAVGDPSHVPVGLYAREALEAAGLWTQLKSKCLPAVDTRAALTYVERREAACGIVYRSDALISRKVRIAFTPPDSVQPDIRYEAGLPVAASHPGSLAFLDFLQSETAGKIFRANGFQPISANLSLE